MDDARGEERRLNTTTMNYELNKLKAWLAVLKDVAEEYSGRTLDNIIGNIEARVKDAERRQEE